MNKTLKVLLAVVLFAVVLMLATGVNAATLKELTTTEIDNPDFDPDQDVGEAKPEKIKVATETKDTSTGAVVYTLNADYAGVITVSGKEVLNLGGKNITSNLNSTAAVTVAADAELRINGTGNINSKAGSTTVAVDNEGTLVVNGGTIASMNNNGTLVAAGGAITKLTNNGTVEETTKAVIKAVDFKDGTITVPADETLSITAPEGYKKYTLASENNPFYYAPEKATTIKVTVQDKDGKDVEAKDLKEEADYYTFVVKEFYGDTELKIDTTKLSLLDLPTGLKWTNEAARQFAVEDGEKYDGAITIRVAYDGKTQTITLGEATPENPDDENKDPEVPGDENKDPEVPGDENNGEDNKNDNELDPDTPNTGDHIIPATALLAVVVVANVVYFAKMKRN